jgi:hypothetical protein
VEVRSSINMLGHGDRIGVNGDCFKEGGGYTPRKSRILGREGQLVSITTLSRRGRELKWLVYD